MSRRRASVKSEPHAIRLERGNGDSWSFYFRGYRSQPAERWDVTRRIYDAMGTGRRVTRYLLSSGLRGEQGEHATLARVREHIAAMYEFV